MSRKKWPPSAEKKVHVNKEAHKFQEKSDHSVARKNWWLMSADYWLIIDDWWLIIDDWWLMIDDWWLMTDIIWNVRYRLPQGVPPGANNMGPISYYICIYFIINLQSSLITHQSSVINHQSSIISYQSSIIHDQWSIISHQLPPVIIFSAFCDNLKYIKTHIFKK